MKRFARRTGAALAIPAMTVLMGANLSSPVHAGAPQTELVPRPDVSKIACSLSPRISFGYTDPMRNPGEYVVYGAGVIRQDPKVYCGQIEFKTFSMTKVCGFWGCHWRQEGISDGGRPTSNEYWTWTGQNCREGTNRYQQISAWTYTNGWGYPTTEWYGSNTREITC